MGSRFYFNSIALSLFALASARSSGLSLRRSSLRSGGLISCRFMPRRGGTNLVFLRLSRVFADGLWGLTVGTYLGEAAFN